MLRESYNLEKENCYYLRQAKDNIAIAVYNLELLSCLIIVPRLHDKTPTAHKLRPLLLAYSTYQAIYIL